MDQTDAEIIASFNSFVRLTVEALQKMPSVGLPDCGPHAPPPHNIRGNICTCARCGKDCEYCDLGDNGTYWSTECACGFCEDYEPPDVWSRKNASDAGLVAAVRALADCSQDGHLVVTTGIGKANLVAQKVAKTLCSLGVRSAFLHPGEAGHGDVGLISKGDIVLAFSTSGKTREVIETLHLARTLGASIIAVTSHTDSEIRPIADIVVDIGPVVEAGYLGIAPTTSTTLMLVVGDFLAVSVASVLGTTMENYAQRHHHGYLGSVARGDGVIK